LAIETFGTLRDGERVERVTIRGGGLTATVLSFGATVQDLRLEGHPPPLVLGFPTFDPYPDHGLFFGAIVGRYANRIAGGRFSINGETYQTDRNFLGKHLLHGGACGTYHRNWTIAGHGPDRTTLTLADRDGKMGFPGNCELSVTFALTGDGVLALSMRATTDKATVVNLSHHGYFNLDGSETVLDHEMQIGAGHYLPVDDEAIPTGEIASVEGTDLDFRTPRALRRKVGGMQALYDHNYCLSGVRTGLREVAKVRSAKSGVTMTLATTEPGLQFYAGEFVSDTAPGLHGKTYEQWAGMCLEPQTWPDAPNRPDFPSALLRPGETYRHETRYRFSME
jgi:aldose 1-epimerase